MPQCEGFTKNGQRCKKTCPENTTKCHIHSNENVCPICMNILTENTSRTLECGHTFHRQCLDRWRRRAPTCPNCRAPFDQPTYRVKITIDPVGYEQENITSNIQSIADMFGLDTSIERFFSTINFAVSNMNDLRTILNEIGFPIPPGSDFPGSHTEG
jgi:hypothetical protein